MAYDLDGINQYLRRASAPVTAVPLTMACWFNHDLLQDASLCSVSNIGGAGTWFGLFTGLTGVVFASTTSSGNQANAITTATYTTGSWNHCCGVFSAINSRTIYLNGGNAVTNTTSRTPSNVAETIIGSRRAGGIFGSYFNGKIAEVGIWNAALTANEIASLAKGMTCDKIRPQSLVFYSPLVRDLIDQKAALAITNNNGATVTQHPRVYA
jgi:hypothetical protein